MARHKLTEEQKLRGVQRGIRVLERKRKNRTGGPTWLIPSMKRYERKLTEQLKRGNSPEAA